jgi:hypothetical protein
MKIIDWLQKGVRKNAIANTSSSYLRRDIGLGGWPTSPVPVALGVPHFSRRLREVGGGLAHPLHDLS